MGKESVVLKLFGEMEERAPLSVKVCNKSGEDNHVHPVATTKKIGTPAPSSLSEKKQSAEYGENIAAGTPEHKAAAPSTPGKSCSSKKRFGWSSIRSQQSSSSSYNHEDLARGSIGLRPASAMVGGSPKVDQSRDVVLELNQFSDTSSSSSSTCSDLSIPSCSSSSLYSGYTTSRIGSDTESASSTPRTTPSKNIPRPGKPGSATKGSHQRTNSTHSNSSMKSSHQNVPHFELQEDPDFWNDHNVQVLVRTRPVSTSESSAQGFTRCVRQDGPHTITWLGQPETRFTFDHVAGESISQEDLFRVAGTPMVENCMRGYNSSMFAYGQTGSGKTHTMLGDIDDLADRPSHQRGMTPRIFEYLFSRIQQEEQLREQEQLSFVCKCSFLEIYNEHITDLLDPSSTNLQIREDVKTGVYVENLKEIEVKNVHDVIQLLIQGAANRKVAVTNMNRESSRSHSVFACTVESKWEKEALTNIRFGRLNLVDLAGSERQKSSGAEGDRLKEAANINKSLSTLGLVIMILVDVANGKQRHVPYRDSKLTFLLQDSLGGNSKTTVIATISPSNSNALETVSTLKFAQRAKFIRNNAHINEDSSGDVTALRREIQQLKEEINHLKCHNVSAMLPMEGDANNLGAIIATPGINASNLHHKIRAVEATLSAALRREQQAQVAAKRYIGEIDQLQTLVQQRDQNTQSGKMILRFRDEKIRRLEAVVTEKLPAGEYLIEENKRLTEELELVRAQIDRNPELTRFAMDNIRLMEQVRGFQEFYEHGERMTMMEDIANLRDQLLEMTETKLALEQGAHALSSAQADKYRKELEICCNDLSTCLEINSTLTMQVEQLKSQVAQLNARCQEQQQDLDFLKAQPMGRFEEMELERSVHLQIIEDLKAQLLQQQKESEELKRSVREDDVKNAVQDKYTVDQNQPREQVQVQLNICVKAELEPDFTADEGSLFDEDIEQIQVCDVKQAAMETEFETFSELMMKKESILDEDLDKLDVCSKRQSLESEFEAYAGILEERKSYDSAEQVHRKVSARTLEIASHFEPFNELMEGEENLLRESMEQLELKKILSTIDSPRSSKLLPTNGDHQAEEPALGSDLKKSDTQTPKEESSSPPALDMPTQSDGETTLETSKVAPELDGGTTLETLQVVPQSDGETLLEIVVVSPPEPECEATSLLLETVEVYPPEQECEATSVLLATVEVSPRSEGETTWVIVEPVSEQEVAIEDALVLRADSEEPLVLAEDSEQNFLSLDSLEDSLEEECLVSVEDSELNLLNFDNLDKDLDSIATETILTEAGEQGSLLTHGDTTEPTTTSAATSSSEPLDGASVLDGELTILEDSSK